MRVLANVTALVRQSRGIGQFLVNHTICCSHMCTVRMTDNSTIPRTDTDTEEERSSESLGPENARLLRVSMIGMPNAGKSTLVNQLLAFNVCPVSKRVHTTRKMQQAIYLNNNTQVVFTDTPGVVNEKEAKKFSFTKEFVQGPLNAIKGSDLVAVIQDVSNPVFRHKLDTRIINILKASKGKNAILILNKVDILKGKRILLETIKQLTNSTVGGSSIPVISNTKKSSHKPLNTEEIMNRATARRHERLVKKNLAQTEIGSNETPTNTVEASTEFKLDSHGDEDHKANGWSHFQDVFMISALNGDGVQLLLDYFVRNAVQAPWIYKEDVLTDCPPTELALNILKSKMLEHLPQEIPYKVTPVLEYWDENDSGGLKVIIRVDCPNERLAKIVIGQAGGNINTISIETEKTLTKVLQQSVDLCVSVKCPTKPNIDGQKADGK